MMHGGEAKIGTPNSIEHLPALPWANGSSHWPGDKIVSLEYLIAAQKLQK
jgi:hypothetical protein